MTFNISNNNFIIATRSVALLFIALFFFTACRKDKVSKERVVQAYQEINQIVEAPDNSSESKLNELQQLIEKEDVYKEPILKAFIYSRIAQILLQDQKENEATPYLNEIKGLLKQSYSHEEYNRIKFFIYYDIGYELLHNNYSIKQANEYLNRGVSIAILDSSKTIPPNDIVKAIYNTSETAYELHRYDEAIHLSEIAKNYIDQLDTDYNEKDMDVFITMFSLFKNLSSKKDVDLNHLKEVIELSQQPAQNANLDRYHDEMKAKYFLLDHQLDSSIIYYKKVLEVDKLNLKKRNSPIAQYNHYESLLNMANVYLENQSPQRAKTYLEQVQSYNEEFITDNILYYRTKIENEYYIQTQQIQKLKETQEKLHNIHTDIIASLNEKSFADTFTDYQLRTNKTNINNLTTKVNIKDRFLNYTTLIASLLALVALFSYVLFRMQQRKRKTDQELNKTQNKLLHQKLLRAQMEPHFIFNTLNTLKSLINLDRKEESMEFLSNFGLLLRNNLELSRKEYVRLYDEIQTLTSYVNLQKVRMTPFEFQIKIQENINSSQIYIPPMLIQPFVENAIIHGITPLTDREGKITLFIAKEQEGYISIKITDNGVGMQGLPKKHDPTRHKSLATAIAQERLEILSKNMSSFQLIENEVGVTVVLTLPYKEKV